MIRAAIAWGRQTASNGTWRAAREARVLGRGVPPGKVHPPVRRRNEGAEEERRPSVQLDAAGVQHHQAALVQQDAEHRADQEGHDVAPLRRRFRLVADGPAARQQEPGDARDPAPEPIGAHRPGRGRQT